MSPVSPTTTSILLGGHPSQEDQHLPLSPPKSPQDSNGLPARQRNKILHQIQQRASPTSSSEPSFPLASFFEQSVYSSTESNIAPLPPSTSETVRVKSEICSPPVSLRPSPSPPDSEDQTLQPSSFAASSRAFAINSHEPSQDSILNQVGESPSSPTARALRSLGLTRADLAQHAQRMKSFLGAGGRRGFPTAADLANVDVKSETTDSEMLLSLSSASSLRRQASVASYASSVCTTTATDMSRASSTYPTGPSTNTSFDTTPSRERRAPRGRTVLPPLPPSSPPPMLSPVRSGESNRTGINSSPIRSPLASPAEAGPSRNYEPGEYTGGSDTPYVLPPGPRTSEKPSASYAALIGQAIMSANPGSDGRKKLTLAHIYAWISAAWPFYKPGEAGWMNSIRHNLSLNDCFVKIKRDGREKGKGSFWSIREGDEDMFANGGFVRRNSNAKKRKKETTPAQDASELQPVDAPKRPKNNPAPGPTAAYVYEPPQYPPLPGTSRSSAAPISGASTSQPPAKRTRVAPPAASVNKKYYRSPLGNHMPSSSPARHESARQERRREADEAASKLTPSMSSSPPMEDSSVSSSPPPMVRPATQPREPEVSVDYPTKSGLMDMVINNSAKKRRVSGGTTGTSRVGALGNGSPVMKRRPNGIEDEPRTIYPASMLSRPRSPTQHINPRVILKTRSEQPTKVVESKPIHNTRANDLGAGSNQALGPITPPAHTTPERSSSDRPGQFVAFKPSDIIPSTPPRTLAPLTMATSAERTPLSHAALHMSPSRPSDLSHFKNSVHPPSASHRDSSGLLMEFRTPMGRDIRRVPSLSGVMLAMPADSPLRTPLGYGGPRDINDLNSGCAEELMTSPTRRLTVTGPGDEQSPSMLFGGMYRSPDGTWGPPPSLNW